MVGVVETIAPGDAATRTVLQTEVISDPEQFAALGREWNDAVERAAVPHPFLTHEWVRTWWDCFGTDAQLRIVVVRDEGRIVAIAPLMLERTRIYGMPVRRMRLLQNDHTPRTDLIVVDRQVEAYRAIWEVLTAGRDEWDVLQLSQILRESPTLGLFQQCAGEAGFATGTWASSESPYLELSGTWEEYLASLGSKFRSNVRNRLTRLTQIGEPVMEVLDDGARILAAREDSMRLEASGWKEQEGTAINSDAAVQRFYARLAERAGAEGWLRLLFLTVNGTRIATSYGARYAGRLFLFKTGYDPAYAKCSPFKVLTWFAVQASYAEGLREVDFLGDTEPWKLEWTETRRGHDWLFVFSDTVRAKLLYRAKFQVAPAVRQWRP